MKLKLKQSVVADKLYVPPAVIDAEALGLSEDEAQSLIDRGVAELAQAEAPAEVEQEQAAAEAETAAAETAAEPASVTAPAPAAKTARARK